MAAAAGGFDYIVVGAGSAGCTLAGRLTEDGAARTLLIEAGGWDRDPWIRIPLGWGWILQHRLHDWHFDAEADDTIDGRVIECFRGKVIGGSSSVNAMAYVRGNPADYDRWAAAGLDGWSYAGLLPYFRRSECWEGGADAYRGGEGPVAVRRSRYSDPVVEAWLAAGSAAGHAINPDYNGASQDGFSVLQSTIRDGIRCSAADAYLRPVLRRPNLTVWTGALATRVVIERGRATGVEVWRRGKRAILRADREVLLAAGAINSPHLMMLSGLGDPGELSRHGIALAAALTGVGRNLQDHLTSAVEYERARPGPFHRAMRADRMLRHLAQAYCLASGFATDLPSGFTAFLRSGLDSRVPDIQLLFRAVPSIAAPHLAPLTRSFTDGFACRAVLLRPDGRGSLALASADPRRPLLIRQRLLASERDRRTMRRAICLVREIGCQRPLASFVGRQIAPEPGATSDAALDSYVRASAATAHHPLGTCRMGVDELAVVDPELRVRGVDGLRIIDASVMPDMIGGNINATVVAIAERASDLILGRPPLRPDGPSPAAATRTESAATGLGEREISRFADQRGRTGWNGSGRGS